MTTDVSRVGTVIPAGAPMTAATGGGLAVPAPSVDERLKELEAHFQRLLSLEMREERWRQAAREVLTPKREGEHLVCRFCAAWAQLGEAVKHRSDCATSKLRAMMVESKP